MATDGHRRDFGTSRLRSRCETSPRSPQPQRQSGSPGCWPGPWPVERFPLPLTAVETRPSIRQGAKSGEPQYHWMITPGQHCRENQPSTRNRVPPDPAIHTDFSEAREVPWVVHIVLEARVISRQTNTRECLPGTCERPSGEACGQQPQGRGQELSPMKRAGCLDHRDVI